MKVRITFTEALLGTLPSNPEIYEKFIYSKSPDAETLEDEIAALGVEEVTKNGMTIFARNEAGQPCMYDYAIKGFFKDACSMLTRLGGKSETGKKKPANESCKLTAYKKIIDGLIFIYDRLIPITINGDISTCQRPLRAQTAQGERVSLAYSESIPAGSTMDFEVQCLDEKNYDAVREWLDYGKLRGLGQWRNSGKGRFEWVEV